jgi:hypothetical protein
VRVFAYPLVVLVDESPATLVELTRSLMLLPISLAWFTSPADALPTIRREPPAIVICGPEISAQEAADFLGDVADRSPRTQRLLLCSGIARPLRSGTAVLRWPLKEARLRTIVARATDFPAAHDS